MINGPNKVAKDGSLFVNLGVINYRETIEGVGHVRINEARDLLPMHGEQPKSVDSLNGGAPKADDGKWRKWKVQAHSKARSSTLDGEVTPSLFPKKKSTEIDESANLNKCTRVFTDVSNILSVETVEQSRRAL
ncbi:hypothetical protein PanWU01x14_277260 [Parasponia andersonii]|uniref:Uncharacterized protein n=1 Tax=Parasponia andersonii TaxID=3476 RepID=A0A2P5B2P7_PARAD|nr:hypothetical protein PanWU01x14_277260 [Parasponia andersonii]